MSNSLLSKSIIYSISVIVNRIFNFLLFPIIVVLLSPNQIGELEILTSIYSLGCLIGTMQIDSAFSRYYYEYSEKEEFKFIFNCLFLIIFFSIISSIILNIFSPYLIIYFRHTSTNKLTYLLLSFNIFLYSIYNFLLTILRFRNKHFIFSITQIVQVAIYLPISYFLIINYTSINSIWYSLSFSHIFCIILVFMNNKINLLCYFNKIEAKKILKFSLPTFPGVLLNWLSTYLNRFIFVKFLSSVELASFAAVNKISSLLLLSDFVLRLVWQPFFWKTYYQKSGYYDIKNIFNILVKYSSFFLLIFCMIDQFIFEKLIDSKLNKLLPLISLLSVAYFFNIFINVIGMGPDIVQKTHLNSLKTFLILFVTVISHIILLPIFKANSIIFSTFISSVTSLLLSWIVSEYLFYIGYSFKTFIRYLLPVLIYVFLELFYEFSFFHKLLYIIFYLCFFCYSYKKSNKELDELRNELRELPFRLEK